MESDNIYFSDDIPQGEKLKVNSLKSSIELIKY